VGVLTFYFSEEIFDNLTKFIITLPLIIISFRTKISNERITFDVHY